ncbi:MAG: hypothetical protein LBR17_09135 [Bacteroidales bacterium]|jgi:tetratricopeptide (TPR) repeat protein|nr:hypothetical protein [Bacteroidales bacterium]
MKLIKYLIIIAFVMFGGGISNNLSAQDQKSIDSLFNVIKHLQGKEKLEAYGKLVEMHYSHVDTALKVSILNNYIKEAHKQNNKEIECSARMMLIEFYRIFNHTAFFDKVDDFLSFAFENKFYYNYFYIWSCKALVLMNERNYEESQNVMEQMYKQAQKFHCNAGIGLSAYTFGRFYLETDRSKEAIPYMKEAINHFKTANKPKDEYIAYFGLFDALNECSMYNEALLLLPEFEKIQAKRDKEFGTYVISEHYLIESRYLKCYIVLKNYEKARQYMKLIDSYIEKLAPNFRIQYKGIRCDYYDAVGDYAKALQLIDSVYDYNTSVGNNYFAIRNLYDKAIYLAKLGRGKEAEKVLIQYKATKDSIDKINTDQRIDELRTKYDVYKIQSENERKLYVIIGLSIFTGLIIILTIINHIAYSPSVETTP